MALATISGVALAPGVSRNRRLYTPELIGRAAKRMQERLADPNGLPIVMRTHHDAGDDSAKIVGRITEVSVDNNKSLRYKADLYDTFHAREIANLVTPQQPALRSVSIHGYWMGDTKQIQTDEGLATTAEDLEIDAIDFTASPGVNGAIIDGDNKATESGGVLRTPIRESMEASVTVAEADCGLAVISKENLQGPRMTESAQEETSVRLGDVTEYFGDGDGNVAGFCIDAYSGPLCVSIRGNVPPDQLRAAATAAASAAMDAINCMDPDNDADIDAGIDDMETATAGGVSPDDSMRDSSSESLEIPVSSQVTPEKDLLEVIREQFDLLSKRPPQSGMSAAQAEQVVAKRLAGETYEQIAAEMDETKDKMTSPPETAETVEGTDNTKESAMGDTQEVAAQAAPQSALTAEDMKLLGETIGNTMAEALRAFAEMSATPKHAAAPQETTEQAEAVAESVEDATPKATDFQAMKESLANELRRDLRNELRAEILEEKGLPPRRGYRLSENAEPEEKTDAELFNQHRMEILLGNYGLPTPAADNSQAA